MLLLETALIFITVLIKMYCSVKVYAYHPLFKSQHEQELLSSKLHHRLALQKHFALLLAMKLEERKWIGQACPLCSTGSLNKIGSCPDLWVFNYPLSCVFWCGV
jgi:hypothetical protein